MVYPVLDAQPALCGARVPRRGGAIAAPVDVLDHLHKNVAARCDLKVLGAWRLACDPQDWQGYVLGKDVRASERGGGLLAEYFGGAAARPERSGAHGVAERRIVHLDRSDASVEGLWNGSLDIDLALRTGCAMDSTFHSAPGWSCTGRHTS